MGDSLFSIFGDHLTRQAMKNVSRQPLQNIENMGKTVSSGPVKPNEPVKKGEAKKSFLSNAGKALQGLQNNTPARKAFTPKAVNVGSLIYNDFEPDDNGFSMDELKFTKPTYKYDNYHRDLLDYLPIPEPEHCLDISPPSSPPPPIQHISMEFMIDDCDVFKESNIYLDLSPPSSPPLAIQDISTEFINDDSDILNDDFSNFSDVSFPNEDLGLPDFSII